MDRYFLSGERGKGIFFFFRVEKRDVGGEGKVSCGAEADIPMDS